MPAGGGAGGLDGFSKPADTSWAQWYELQNIFRVGRLGLSLGIPDISIRIPRISIPGVVPRVAIPQAPTLSQPIIRPSEPLIKTDVMSSPSTILRQSQKKLLGIPLGPTGRLAASTLWDWVKNAPMPGVIEAQLRTQNATREETRTVLPKVLGPGAGTYTGEPAMDLGDLFGQLGTAYIQAKYSGAAPAGMAAPPSFGTAGGAIPTTPALGVPFVDVIPEATTKGMLWSPRANCGAGGWVKRRRRRKRLASKSDLGDLAALKAILGPSMLKTWIAVKG